MLPAGIPAPDTQVIPSRANLFKAVLLIGLLFSGLQLSSLVGDAIDRQAWPVWAAGLAKGAAWFVIAFLNSLWLIGMAALAHDAVHRVLFRSRFINDLWGGALSALTLLPFHANRQFHLAHHSFAHQPGRDPEDALFNRPFARAILFGAFLGWIAHYRLLSAALPRLHRPGVAARVAQDILFVSLAILFYLAVVPMLGIDPWVSVLPLWLVFPFVSSARALTDHYGLPAVERPALAAGASQAAHDAWHAAHPPLRAVVTGWVVRAPRWLEWLWSDLNYHEVHHKYPWLSHRYLRAAWRAGQGRDPYAVLPGYGRGLGRLARQSYYGVAPPP